MILTVPGSADGFYRPTSDRTDRYGRDIRIIRRIRIYVRDRGITADIGIYPQSTVSISSRTERNRTKLYSCW